jgi:hypothetical protein
MWRWTGGQGDLGLSVARLNDINGDKLPEVIVGAGSSDLPEQDTGALWVLSGKDASILRSAKGKTQFDSFGSCVAAIGDLNHDGVEDYLAGAKGVGSSSSNQEEEGMLPLVGAAYVFSGKDGRQLLQINGPHANCALGSSACAMGDLNGDGMGDLAIAGGPRAQGWIGVYSGSDGTLIYAVRGQVVANAGDVDGDKHADLLLGIWALTDSIKQEAPGLARVVSGAP